MLELSPPVSVSNFIISANKSTFASVSPFSGWGFCTVDCGFRKVGQLSESLQSVEQDILTGTDCSKLRQ